MSHTNTLYQRIFVRNAHVSPNYEATSTIRNTNFITHKIKTKLRTDVCIVSKINLKYILLTNVRVTKEH